MQRVGDCCGFLWWADLSGVGSFSAIWRSSAPDPGLLPAGSSAWASLAALAASGAPAGTWASSGPGPRAFSCFLFLIMLMAWVKFLTTGGFSTVVAKKVRVDYYFFTYLVNLGLLLPGFGGSIPSPRHPRDDPKAHRPGSRGSRPAPGR